MDIKKLLVVSVFLLFASQASAELYLELGIEGGGETLIESTLGDEVNAGGGVKFAAGIQNVLDEDNTASYRLALGYMFDTITASNGEAEFDTLTLDAVYLKNSGPHTFGIGAAYHMSPEYSDDVDGFSSLNVEFDDALGLLLQYGYNFSGFEIGIRFTQMEYEFDSIEVDADSVGLYMSNGF